MLETPQLAIGALNGALEWSLTGALIARRRALGGPEPRWTHGGALRKAWWSLGRADHRAPLCVLTAPFVSACALGEIFVWCLR